MTPEKENTVSKEKKIIVLDRGVKTDKGMSGDKCCVQATVPSR